MSSRRKIHQKFVGKRWLLFLVYYSNQLLPLLFPSQFFSSSSFSSLTSCNSFLSSHSFPSFLPSFFFFLILPFLSCFIPSFSFPHPSFFSSHPSLLSLLLTPPISAIFLYRKCDFIYKNHKNKSREQEPGEDFPSY